MLINERNFSGVFEIRLEPHEDKRGFFMRVYDDKIFREHGIHRNWVHENHSRSIEKGVIRGMHFQLPPFAEAKLVRAIRGEIYDVFIDLRKNSPTFGRWGGIRLSAQNKKMVLIPRGFAHGFCTMTENCEVLYKIDNYYSPQHEGIIRWNDPNLRIQWNVQNPILSEKDSNAKSFNEFLEEHGGLET